MTNGEKMQEMFQEGKTRRCRGGVVFKSDGWCHAYDSDWWNAEYKEPTTKNNLGVEEHKGEVMDFPNTFDDFVKDYGFKDKEEVYTNGSELIQVYRVKQWLEHINETTTMIDKSNFSQEQYKTDLQSAYDCGYEQAKNDLGVDREDAVERLNALKQLIGYDKDSEIVKATQKSLDMAIKALDQEPMVEIDLYSVIKQKYIEREVIDKIRAEIEQLTIVEGGDDYVRKMAELFSLKMKVLQIIDKYKAESEADNGNDD